MRTSVDKFMSCENNGDLMPGNTNAEDKKTDEKSYLQCNNGYFFKGQF